MKQLVRLKGFGMPPNTTNPSPFAQKLLGPRPDLPERSELSFALVRKDMMEMGTNTTVINDPMFKLSCLKAYSAFRLEHRAVPYHLKDFMDLDLDIRKSSPGIPWQPLYKTKGEVMDCPAARGSIRWFWHRVKKGESVVPPDCKVLYRAHLKDGITPKIRAVYGYPATMTFGEGQFALPLIQEFKKGGTPMAYGYDMLTGGAMRLRRRMMPFKHYACIDFRKFDKTVSEQLIRVAFDILSQNVDFCHYKDHGVPDARRLHRAWEYIIDYFINTRLRLPNGERYKKSAGVPSGSYFTQLIDSIVNYIIIVFSWLKAYGREPCDVLVFGDDSVVADDLPISKFVIAEVIDRCGMEMNPKKSLFTDRVDAIEFLGFCIQGGFPHRSLDGWLASLYHPEYPDRNWDYFASRTLGLAYANHGIEPTFDNICRVLLSIRDFEPVFNRDFSRFLSSVGIDPGGLSRSLPTRREFLFDLIR